MSSSNEKMIRNVTKALEEIGFASTADVARKIGTSRQTASKYLKKAEEKGLASQVYGRKDTKIYSLKPVGTKNKTKTPLEVHEDSENAFKNYEILD